MKDFIISALPWVIMGITVAIAVVNGFGQLNKHKKKLEASATLDENKQQVKEGEEAEAAEEESEENYMAVGMTMGACLGIAMSTAIHINIAYGISLGMMIGMVVGVRIHQQ